MAGQKFQYDESGSTFYYFVLSFSALLLVPYTYYWWPRKPKKDEETVNIDCNCAGCKKKKLILEEYKPWKLLKDVFIKFTILVGWCFLLYLTYKVSQFEYEYANFDPHDILGIPLGSSDATVKKAYRRLSLILHPDKETGNEKAFMTLTKAYQALTDEESRRNWEKYGNPDGPGAMSFGIALPSWIVEKENSVWVLGLYALVFMVALPIVVGTWWYKSIRYSGDKVLLDTTKMYYYFFHKTPSMALKRVIMILGASLEFEKKYNNEIIERESDNFEVPKLISQIHNLGEKNRERPLYYKYSLKARAIIHAHLSRMPLNPETLDIDRMIILKKCPTLIQEMINCISQLILLAYAQRVPRLLNIETLENCMKLCPMIVQALWECKSPLLQLPHIKEEHLKHFVIKKRYIRNIQQFARLKHEDKRCILKFLKDDQFEDIMQVVNRIPYIEFKVRCEVIDDEASTVYTAGAIVTVTVTLNRKNFQEVYNDNSAISVTKKENNDEQDAGLEDGDAEHNNDEDKTLETAASQRNKMAANKPAWQKKPQKSSKKGNKKQQKKQQKKQLKPNSSEKKVILEREHEKPKLENGASCVRESNSKAQATENENCVAMENNDESELNENTQSSSEDEHSGNKITAIRGSDNDKSNTSSNKNDTKESCKNDEEEEEEEEEEDDWEKFQSGLNKKERILEGRRKQSHSVHCPYFPEDKQEYWWVYVSDRKSRTLLTPPYHVTELIDYEEIQLKFTAPRWPGMYKFAVCLRSDSYLGFDQIVDIKLDVKDAPEVPVDHPQWDISDDDDDEQNEGNEDGVSEFTTDEDVED